MPLAQVHWFYDFLIALFLDFPIAWFLDFFNTAARTITLLIACFLISWLLDFFINLRPQLIIMK